MIIFNNTKVTSTKKIANIANQYFLDKITNLRKKFTTPKFPALNFLTSLIDRNKNCWHLKPITVEQTLDILKKAWGTNATCIDPISMRALKLIDTLIAPHLCHLINTIHLTCIYPEILKTSLMSPVCRN